MGTKIEEYLNILFKTTRIVSKLLNDGNMIRPDGTIKYIACNHSRFHDNIVCALSNLNKSPSDIKFLDVGSGIGDKLLIAKEVFGLNVTGLEIDEQLIDLSQLLLRQAAIKPIHIDAFDFRNWSDFDIIYYYRPIAPEDVMITLEHLIESQMKDNSILISINKLDRQLDSTFTNLSNDVWIRRT